MAVVTVLVTLVGAGLAVPHAVMAGHRSRVLLVAETRASARNRAHRVIAGPALDRPALLAAHETTVPHARHKFLFFGSRRAFG